MQVLTEASSGTVNRTQTMLGEKGRSRVFEERRTFRGLSAGPVRSRLALMGNHPFFRGKRGKAHSHNADKNFRRGEPLSVEGSRLEKTRRTASKKEPRRNRKKKKKRQEGGAKNAQKQQSAARKASGGDGGKGTMNPSTEKFPGKGRVRVTASSTSEQVYRQQPTNRAASRRKRQSIK